MWKLPNGNQNQNENNITSGSEVGGVSIDSIKNLYESSVAIENTWGEAKTANYPDFKVIEEIYKNVEEQENDEDDSISNTEGFQKILEEIEKATGADIFEFDENGQNSNGASEPKSINNDGTLTEQSCPKTGKKECTCKVTDGFGSIDDLFSALAGS